MTKRQCWSLHECSCAMGSLQFAWKRKIQGAKAPFGAINFKPILASLRHSILKHWEHPTQMPTHALRKMKTYKPSFTSPNVCMHKGWRWQGMAHIGNRSATKQLGYKKLIWSLISTNLKWFLKRMPSYPPFFFPSLI
jgi:hypothetical protein